MLRKILGVIAGALLAFLLVMLLEAVINYAMAPAAIDPSDTEGMKEMMANMPASAFLAVLLTYFLATLAGGFVAAKIARERWAAWVVAGLILAATLANVAMLPHPLWFTLSAVVLIAAAGWLGGQLAFGGIGSRGDSGNAGDGGWSSDAGRKSKTDDGWADGSDGGGDGGGGD